MFKIILLTFFLLFGVATSAQGDWYIVQEPTLDKLIEWVPEEVPRKLYRFILILMEMECLI